MRLPYKDPNLGDYADLGFSLKKSIRRVQHTVSHAAEQVVGSKVVSEVERAGQRTLETGSPTTVVPIVLNPVGLVYGAVKGDPTSLTALEIGGAAVGIPPGALSTGASLVNAALSAAGVPGIGTPGVIAGPGGPNYTGISLLDEAPPQPRVGPKLKTALVVVGIAAFLYWRRKRR